jgi:hypothetical protein
MMKILVAAKASVNEEGLGFIKQSHGIMSDDCGTN